MTNEWMDLSGIESKRIYFLKSGRIITITNPKRVKVSKNNSHRIEGDDCNYYIKGDEWECFSFEGEWRY